MSESFAKTVAATALDWSGVTPANTAAVVMAGQLAATAAGFAAQRGRMAFEAEPAAFANALREAR